MLLSFSGNKAQKRNAAPTQKAFTLKVVLIIIGMIIPKIVGMITEPNKKNSLVVLTINPIRSV